MSLYRKCRRLIRKLQPRFPRTPHEPLDVTLARARRAWIKAMGPYRNSNDMVMLPDYPPLAAEHLANCRVVPIRPVSNRCGSAKGQKASLTSMSARRGGALSMHRERVADG